MSSPQCRWRQVPAVLPRAAAGQDQVAKVKRFSKCMKHAEQLTVIDFWKGQAGL